MQAINQTTAWAKLKQHQEETQHLHMRDLFHQDPFRFEKMHNSTQGLLFDYSKNRITEKTISLLIELAQAASLNDYMEQMRRGEKINLSENRPVIHTMLRQAKPTPLMIDGEDISLAIYNELHSALDLAERIRKQSYIGLNGKPIRHIVNLGIGGSDLGPQLLYQALHPYHADCITVDYVSNVDAADLMGTLEKLDPAQTLFIVASKSFTTQETLLNARTAKQWLQTKTGITDVRKHFVAITSNREKALAFGIDSSLIFRMFDGVGGRYSVWSSISLSVMCAIGRQPFLDFLAGAHAMDQHFFTSPFQDNIPVLMGLIGIWYNTFYKSDSHAIIPYDHSLRRLPAYLQQLDMESNGKHVSRTGETLSFNTGAVIWGEEGINCQHAFFQLLHQGTRLICTDFIIVAKSFYPHLAAHHQMLVANGIAQSRALMQGKTAEVRSDLDSFFPLSPQELAAQQYFPGNQPSNTLFLSQLTPFNLGLLLALYEHKVFVQGIIWGVNSFDQWGVEYGKILAKQVQQSLIKEEKNAYDSSTDALIAFYKSCHNR